MITEREAESHPNANIITRAVGAAEQLRVETATVEVRSGDLFLLASDGLTRLVSDEEILSALQGGDIETSAVNLLELALDRDAPDNISLIIVRGTDAPAAHSRTLIQHGLQWQ
jgi:serine/threonine protein phosphatase PrpC